ncbi:MAG: radical SAM protein [Myxococcota bacterium]|nr:radical SAM protein [Myxococcota bacterium]
MGRLRETWDAFWEPEIKDERRAARRVWDGLPHELRVEDQVLGRHSAGCAATYGVMEACDFYCTACYLSDEANHTPPLPFEDIKEQLDLMRKYLGPYGNAQITAGEVTLLPEDDLIRIIRYAKDIELSPMLMTNGQNILKNPRYLERLVREADLDKIAIHIDTTEKGRLGLKKSDTEKDIHWIRDAFANLLRQTRKKTKKTLNASQTFTVTEKNFYDIPDVLEWSLDNVDAFRMISFQPTAEVGRTRDKEQIGKNPQIWDVICEGLGQKINKHPLKFGHPDCNTVAMMFVISWIDEQGDQQRRLMEVTRDNEYDRKFFFKLLCEGFAGFSPDGESGEVLLARILGRLRKHPSLAWEISTFCANRALQERQWIPSFLSAFGRGRFWQIKPFVIVIHNFMSAHELQTETGQQRLQACAFRIPIDGRMVSMCEVNGKMRTDLNRRDQERLIQLGNKRQIKKVG